MGDTEARTGAVRRGPYLHHGGELHGVAAPAGGEADAALPGAPRGVDGAVVAGAVTAPPPRAVVEPTPVVAVGLEVLRGGELGRGGGQELGRGGVC